MSIDYTVAPAPARVVDRDVSAPFGWGPGLSRPCVSALAAYLVPRLRSMPDMAQPRSAQRADLALVERLLRSTGAAMVGLELLDRQRHRLMFDVAERYGWTDEPDFLPEWKL